MIRSNICRTDQGAGNQSRVWFLKSKIFLANSPAYKRISVNHIILKHIKTLIFFLRVLKKIESQKLLTYWKIEPIFVGRGEHTVESSKRSAHHWVAQVVAGAVKSPVFGVEAHIIAVHVGPVHHAPG